MTARELFLGSDDGARLRVIADTMRVFASAGDTGGAFEIFEMTGPRDSGPPQHAHPWTESYTIVKGTLDVLLGDKVIPAGPGCFFQIPAGTFHAYRVTSDVAKVVIVTSPSGAGDFFKEVDAMTDIEAIVGTALRHGFTLPQ
jgi:quercetin dioxygenase-like cupin family protein